MRLAPQEQQAVRKALGALPPNHPARIALLQGADPVALTQLVEQDEVAQALQEIWFEAYRRRLASARRP
jgi:hypothetical protein